MKNMDKRLLLASPHMSDEGYELEYIQDAFRKNWIAPLGENVNEFEKAMGDYMGKGYPVALSAGTAALHLAMILAGVKPGDTVFCQSLTFSASANPIAYCGAKPVFIDSEHETWNMDPAALRRAFELYGAPKAVVVVHLYGNPAKLDEITAICRGHNVPLIEDAAEALGVYIQRPEVRHLRRVRRPVLQRQQDHHHVRRRYAAVRDGGGSEARAEAGYTGPGECAVVPARGDRL